MGHAKRGSQRSILKRWWFWGAIVVVVLLACGSWVGIRALQAKSDLEAATPLVTTLKTQLAAENTKGATATLNKLTPKVVQARALTSDPIWRAAEILPVLGPNLSAVRQLAAVTDNVVEQGITPLIGVVDSVSPSSFKPVNGAISDAPIVAATPKIDAASTSLDAAVKQVSSIKTAGLISQVSSATTELKTMLTKVSGELDQVRAVVAILPGALGNSGARNYLVVFQNDGELKAGGGTIGSMALINVDKGKITLKKQSSASLREFPRFSTPVVALPAGLTKLYPAGLGTQVQDLTETPRFSLSFDIAQAMWKKAKGDNIDGLISLDTVALSYILKATGPITMINGGQLTSANAVQTMLGGLYEENYTSEYVDQINEGIASATFKKVSSGAVDPKALVDAVLKASTEHRIQIWTPRKDEQAVIEKSPFYGTPPVSTPSTDAFGVYYSDQTPSKMEYYLRQKVQLSQATCTAGGKRNVQVAVTLTNAAPANAASLPTYVTGTGALTPRGDIKLAVNTYAPPGFTSDSVTNNGKPAGTVKGNDGEYPVLHGQLTLPPGSTQTLVFNFVAGNNAVKTLTAPGITPTVSATVVTTGKLDCSTVTK
jgi:hypothetical protein